MLATVASSIWKLSAAPPRVAAIAARPAKQKATIDFIGEPLATSLSNFAVHRKQLVRPCHRGRQFHGRSCTRVNSARRCRNLINVALTLCLPPHPQKAGGNVSHRSGFL